MFSSHCLCNLSQVMATGGVEPRCYLTRCAITAVVAACIAFSGAVAVGCGEPATNVEAVCSDWQCSRLVTVVTPMTGINDTLRSYFCVRGFDLGSGPCASDPDCYRNLHCNASHFCDTSSDSAKNPLHGYLGVTAAVLLFGSNYLPVRKMKTGHGIFFQFSMAIGILTVGIAVQLIRNSNVMYPAAMLGGMLWSIGNCASVRVINALGVGLAVTTWGCSNMLMGWASGRFGIWGIKPQEPSSEAFSVLSVVLAVVGIVLFGLVKSGEAGTATADPLVSTITLQDGDAALGSTVEDKTTPPPLRTGGRLLGFVLALGCGVLYGFTFDPSQQMMDQYASRSLVEDVKYSPNGLDYAFSAFLGIFLTATAYLLLTVALSRFGVHLEVENTTPPMEMFLPAYVSGVMWAAAASSWFVANTNLGLAVSFPLIALGPCVVASLWGILYLKEIHGRRNFMFLGVAFLFVAASCTCTVLAA